MSLKMHRLIPCVNKKRIVSLLAVCHFPRGGCLLVHREYGMIPDCLLVHREYGMIPDAHPMLVNIGRLVSNGQWDPKQTNSKSQ